jgi:methylthioribose-1-phosphate isomerase
LNRGVGPEAIAKGVPFMNVRIGSQSLQHRTVTFNADRNVVELIEQRLLPHEFRIVETRDFRATSRAIRNMIVRGAGAIGATAAYGLAQGARAFRGHDLTRFRVHLKRVFRAIHEARPTAVDPLNAMNGVLTAMRPGKTVAERQALALAAAEEFAQRNVLECQAIGRHGAPLIKEGMRILTHCNAGWLAFVDYGSATAPLYTAHDRGRRFHVYCDETRPRSQGATLTAWELAQHGIAHEIIADNAAGHLMQRGDIDLVIVGSDRTLGRTGEVANKIGTYTKAVLAARHGIPFYVAIPFSTLDWTLESGREITIEERSQDEVLGTWGVPTTPGRQLRSRTARSSELLYVRVANPTSTARNPAFDITPPEVITGIITPAGIFRPQDLWTRRAELQ